jgi:molybdopterin converting factor small subunit
MSVEVVIPPFLQSLAGDNQTVMVSGRTVAACLAELTRIYPALKFRLFTSRGKLRRNISLFINGASVIPGDMDAAVHDSDKLYITSIIMGG